MNEVWFIFISLLGQLQKEYKIKISAFVLMNNHFHLLLLTPEEDIDRVMYFFMKKATIKIQKSSGRINKIFGGRYKGSMIEHHRYLLNVYKYIYRNPVAAKICDKAEVYEFSTLYTQFYNKKIPFDIDPILEGNELEWINQGFKDNEAQSIQYGLKKGIFKYKKDRISRKEMVPV